MGSAFHGAVANGGGGNRIDSLIAEADSLRDAKPSGSALGDELRKSPLVRKALLGRGDEASKIKMIQDFHKTLVAQMEMLNSEGAGRKLQKLKVPLHIPKDVMDQAEGNFKERHALQQQLQNAIVKLSEMDRGYVKNDHGKAGPTAGAALAPSPEKFDQWRRENQSLFLKLEKMFKSEESALHFERIPGTRAYKAVAPSKKSDRIAELISQMGLK